MASKLAGPDVLADICEAPSLNADQRGIFLNGVFLGVCAIVTALSEVRGGDVEYLRACEESDIGGQFF